MRGVYPRPAPRDRFLTFVNKTPTCWLWTGHTRGEMRYGAFWLDGRTTTAHRAAFTLFVSDIPAGQQVLHRCDEPKCVRPDHLFLGTQADNMADKAAKGRCHDQRGERSHTAKLSRAQVADIKAKYLAGGVSQRALAASYKVSQRTVSDLLRGVCWKD
jgi:hypothetical protein